jgi:hypothetical protein
VNEADLGVPEQVSVPQLRLSDMSSVTVLLLNGPTIVPKSRSVFFVSESGDTMFTVAFADAVFAAEAGVVNARAASAPAEVRIFFIMNFPTGQNPAGRFLKTRHPWRRY